MEKLPEKMQLLWARELPPLQPAFWQTRQERVQFDAGYEPVVLGKTLIVASSRNDSVTALDTDTGAEKWRFFADGPVRLAPAAWNGRAFVAADDGFLYCLAVDSGKLLWKFRAVPSPRKILGNGRLISVWPARGGPVTTDGRVYFAAGVWPFEGIFIHALDAMTGQPLWVNDRIGSLYLEHPHGAMSFGGPSPQGYLMIHGPHLVVPSGRAFPAFLDLKTGQLDTFEFGHAGHGSRPGGWFVCSDSEGQLCIDPEINAEIHDVGPQTIGQLTIRRLPGEPLQKSITVGGKSYRIERGVASTIRVAGQEQRPDPSSSSGPIHRMLVADGKQFLVSRSGQIRCMGPGDSTGPAGSPRRHPWTKRPLERSADLWTSKVQAILAQSGQTQGYAVVLGMRSGRLIEEFLAQSQLQVIAIDPESTHVDAVRRRLDEAGLYGTRVAVHQGSLLDFAFPPYLANLIVCEDPVRAGYGSGQAFLEAAFAVLRPYGGTLCLVVSRSEEEKIAGWLKQPGYAGARLRREQDLLLVTRAGPPLGAANYLGEANSDATVRAPLGILWFGDTVHHHKLFYQGFTHETGRGLPTTIQVVDGVMQYVVAKTPHGPNPAKISYFDYLQRLNTEPNYRQARVDVYTGRELPEEAQGGKAEPPPSGSANAVAAAQRDAGSLGRRNPITSVEEAREFLKTYGCDQLAVDYGNVLTMRSGTAAFYDKHCESGTINVSGIRSGCRNSIVPACGVLNLPSWTGNCTCNYPLFTSLALATMPAEFEQWTAWGGVAIEAPVRRVGINFGAPGDRMAEDGTLWLDWPSVGGPSPQIPVQVVPPDAQPFYRHALGMRGGQGWPWVFASGLRGVHSVRIETVARRSASAEKSGGFSVRWTGTVQPQFTETYTLHARSDRGLRLWLDDRQIVDSARKRREPSGEWTAAVPLTAGQKHRLQVEYFGPRNAKAGEPAVVELSWSSSSLPKQVIPAERLTPPGGKPGGLAGAYYDNLQLSGPAMLQIDPQLAFDWTDPSKQLPAAIQRCRRPGQAVEQSFTVRLAFAEPDEMGPGQRVFSVRVQGKALLNGLDIAKEAGGPRRGLVREFRGVRAKDAVQLEFAPATDKPAVVCGVELISEGPSE